MTEQTQVTRDTIYNMAEYRAIPYAKKCRMLYEWYGNGHVCNLTPEQLKDLYGRLQQPKTEVKASKSSAKSA